MTTTTKTTDTILAALRGAIDGHPAPSWKSAEFAELTRALGAISRENLLARLEGGDPVFAHIGAQALRMLIARLRASGTAERETRELLRETGRLS